MSQIDALSEPLPPPAMMLSALSALRSLKRGEKPVKASGSESSFP